MNKMCTSIKNVAMYDFPPGGFSHGLACISIGSCGYMNKNGQWIIPSQFDTAGSFSEGLALVGMHRKGTDDYLYGFIDTEGRLVIPFQYISANSFSEGVTCVEAKFKTWYLIDRNGTRVSDILDYEVGLYNNGLAVAEIQDRYNLTHHSIFIDRSLKQAIPGKFNIALPFSDSLAAVNLTHGGEFGYINRDGEFVIQPQFESAHPFIKGKAIIKRKGELYRVIKVDGSQAIDKPFEWVDYPSEGVSLFREKGKYGYINIDTGDLELKPEYDRAWGFSEGLALVEKDKRYFYINHLGEEVINGYFPTGEAIYGTVQYKGLELPDKTNTISYIISNKQEENEQESRIKESSRLIKENRISESLNLLRECVQSKRFMLIDQARFWIAIAFAAQERYEMAAGNITMAIEYRPEKSIYRLASSQIYYLLFQQREIESTKGIISSLKVLIKNQQDKPVQMALDDLSFVIRTGGGNARIYYMRALIFEQIGDRQLMLENYSSAKLLDPHFETLTDGGGWLDHIWGQSPLNAILKDI